MQQLEPLTDMEGEVLRALVALPARDALIQRAHEYGLNEKEFLDAWETVSEKIDGLC